ncbi:MAG: hypothetical protein GEV03_09345 [Streptosporangiales bacterium]|nr:hypothetical protein [Streptosporangiales bacterium]
MGQLVPRVRWPRWRLRLVAGLTIGLAVLLLVMAALLFADGITADPDDIDFMLFEIVFIVIIGASFGDAYVSTRTTELVVRLDTEGVEVAAGKYSLAIPWSRVERFWVVRSGSECPILCIAASDLSGFAPSGVRWRLKALANRRLFGTPLATPLVNTGLSELGLLGAVRGYLDESEDAATRPPATAIEAASAEDPEPTTAHRRFRRRLAAGLVALVAAVIGVIWFAAIAVVVLAHGETAPAGLEIAREVLRTVSALAIALAATLLVAGAATRLYRAIVPLSDVAQFFREPVLRVGPEGVEHVVRGRSKRLPWAAVRRIYLSGDRSGSRFVCVTTADPLALVPQVPRWSAKATENERRHGAPVAVPFAGAGLTEQDLLNAVQHYSEGQVTVG